MTADAGYWRFFAYLNLFIFAMLNLVLAENLVGAVPRAGRASGSARTSSSGSGTRPQERGRGQQGVHRQPHRRLRPSSWRCSCIFQTVDGRRAAGAVRARLHDAARARAPLAALSPAPPRFWVRSCCSWAPRARARRSRSSSGCPTPWPARRPSSALIHAATMVTAGLYLLARLSPLVVRARPPWHHRDRRRAHGHHGGDGRHHAERHQEGAGLLDGQPARLHVPRGRRGRVLGGHLPRHDPRLLQGAASSSARAP